MRQNSIVIGLVFTAATIQIAAATDILDVSFTVPLQTRGEGDQFPWTQLANGDHITVVNDGRGPHTAIGNNVDRRTSNIMARISTFRNSTGWG